MSHKTHTYSAHGAWFLDNPIRRWLQPPHELIDKLGITGEQTAMDFGCGPGYFTVELAKRAGRVVAADLQAEMLQKAQRKAQKAGATNIQFLQSNGTQIELPDASVDLILLVTVFHELANPADVLKEFRRILKPQGRLAIVEVTKKGTIPGAPVQNPQAIQAQVEAANLQPQQTQPYKNYSILTFSKKT